MCSIAGIVNFTDPQQAVETVRAMNDAQRHRGPDGDGIRQEGRAVLGHRRLSIIDLTGGAQPMANEDDTLQVVFNGEIYNFHMLRDMLRQKGHTFRTASDTEVLLHLYEEYGEAMLPHLSGMFAFALWDSAKQRLLLARDRIGQKPLVYFRNGKELVFASELAALKRHPAFPHQISENAVGEYLSLLYVPADKSIYSGVKKLRPGHFMSFDAVHGKETIASYWEIAYAPKLDISFEDAVRHTRKLLTAAVQKRLMADVPSGTFLSGGLDSAIITALATQLRAANGERTSAFTIGFDDPAYDERAGAAEAAQTINRATGGRLDQFVKVADPSDFGLVERLLPHYGEPFADASMLPCCLLSDFAAGSIKMALSGDGADEVFAGYERYLVMKYASHFDRFPDAMRAMLFRTAAKLLPDAGERTRSGRLRRLCRVIAQPESNRYFAILDRCPPPLKRKLFGERLRAAIAFDSGASLHECRLTAPELAERCMELDLHTYLPGDTLPKMDIASMAASLEVRSPFLDHELLEFAAILPFRFKQCGRSRKHILKAAFADLVPETTLRAGKRGFGVPVARWLRECWRARVSDILFEGPLLTGGWIDAKELRELWEAHQNHDADHSYILWELTILSLFLSREP